MGEASRRKHEVLHRKKLFDGRTDAVSLWRATVIGNTRCGRCKTARAIGTINMFCPASDFERAFPAIALQYATECKGKIPIAKFKVYGEIKDYVAMPIRFFCGACRREMEAWSAHAPSYIVTEIRTGPERDKIIGQVPKKIEVVRQ